MRSELEIPLEFSCVTIQRDQRIGVKIVARARVTIPVRAGIAGSPEDRVLVGVVSAGHPSSGGAVLRSVARPGFDAWLAGSRYGPESPRPLTGLRIVSVDE